MDSILWLIIPFLYLPPTFSQQYYDGSGCSSGQTNPGSKYTCSLNQNQNQNQNQNHSCQTFLIYRANPHYNTITKISNLFNATSDTLLQLNNATSPSSLLSPPREVLIPIRCLCSGQFSQATLLYNATESSSLSRLACGVFEGLTTELAMAEENSPVEIETGSNLIVPLKCACPDDLAMRKGVKYLVTYPFVEGDETIVVSEKFGVSPEELWEANELGYNPTVYPLTTVLVPLRDEPLNVMNLNIAVSPPPAEAFLPTISVEKSEESSETRRVFIAGSVIGLSVLVVVVIVFVFYVKASRKWKEEKIQYRSFSEVNTPVVSPPATARSSVCLSPDLVAGIKFSLFSYTEEGISRATGDFSEGNKLACGAYKGVMENGVGVMITRMRFEETRRVFDVHSKINHVNIVKLLGVCYGDNSDSRFSYLVFEYPERGCMANTLLSPVSWAQRVRIAFDIANGLHYLHCCIFPAHVHANVHVGNIFLMADFRAKLGGIGPGEAGEKADVLAFGVVLLEVISGLRDGAEEEVKERVGFLESGASEGGWFEGLRGLMDPCLKEEYSLPEALCLAVLAKACLEDDPLNRPSMDDVIKVLSRMV